MLDNQLIKIIISILRAGMTNLGPNVLGTDSGLNIITDDGLEITTDSDFPDVAVKQSFQPTQQGINTGPTIYLHKIGDRRIGSPYRESVWDRAMQQMKQTTIQQYETTFQITGLATQDPSDVNSLTASDIANYAAYVMQTEETITGLEDQGIGILRVTEVRNPYFIDDRQRHEASPSFDFTLTHKQTIITTAPVLEAEEIQILRV